MTPFRMLAIILGLGVVLALVAGTLLTRPGATTAPRPAATPAQLRPSASATPTVGTSAEAVAERFTSAYLDYNWSAPTAPTQAFYGITTQRLYASLAGGANPDGSRAPWTDVAASLHEVDTVQVNGVASQVTSGSVAVREQVVENSRTDAGQSSTPKEIDLTVVEQSGTWLVDWVSERAGATQ